MRKSIAIVMAAVLPATIAAGALGLTSASAAAAPETTVVRSSDDIAASGLTMYNRHANPDPATGTFSMVSGPLTAPAGAGSLQISVGTDAATNVGLCDGGMFNYDLSVYLVTSDPNDVIYFPVTYKPAALNLSFSALASDFPVTVNLTIWRGSSPVTLDATIPQGAAWQDFDVRTAQFFDPTDVATTKLLKDWVLAGDSVAGICVGTDAMDSASIATSEKFNIDNLVYGLTGYNFDPTTDANAPTTDFEPAASAPTVVQSASALTVNSGAAATLSATVTSGAAAVPSARVQLWAKAFGATVFTPIASATTNAAGVASVVVKPTKNTAYKWGYDGVANLTEASPVLSAQRVVNSRIVITTRPLATSFRTTSKLVVIGATTPAKPGATVSVYVKKSTALSYVLAGTAKVASNGSWVFSKALAKGSWKVYSKIASQTGNVGATSVPFAVTVS